MFGWGDSTELQLLKTVYKAILRACPYKNDPDIYPGVPGEAYYTVAQGIDRGGLDCDDYALAIYDCALDLGFKAHILEGWTAGGLHWATELILGKERYVACNYSRGVVPIDKYLGRVMKNYRQVSEEELQRRRKRYKVHQ